MQLVKPTPYAEAIQKFDSRSPIGSTLNSAEWARIPVALRERAFLSATIESARALQRTKDMLGDFLTSARETIILPDGTTTTALKVGSRAEFIDRVREHMISEGIGPLDPKDFGTIKDIRSEKRLGLIFDTQTQAAYDHGYWKQGMDPDVLDEFPAQRFVREVDVRTPRPYHQAHEGEVRLKTDLEFWLSMNPDFGVPWGPWGFNSGMGVEDVDRTEAEALGLIKPGERIEPVDRDFNVQLKAGVRGLDDGILDYLRSQFGDQISIRDGEAQWSDQPDEPAPRRRRPR